MDKKILKAMFANVVASDELRPVMNGVYFDEAGECVGSDGHLLIVYRCGNTKFDGKIIHQSGEEIVGRYPNYRSVIPAAREEYKHRIDLKELMAACQYHLKKEGSNPDDRVSILHKTFVIKNLFRILSVFNTAGKLKEAVMYKADQTTATVIECKLMTAIIMPCQHFEESVDVQEEDGSPVTISYESLVNDYAFNSWKKQESKDWMDEA